MCCATHLTTHSHRGLLQAEYIRSLGPTTAPSFQYLYKPMERSTDGSSPKTAVLMMNAGSDSATLQLNFSDVPGVTCTSCHVRDVWGKKDLGVFAGSYTVSVAAHDAPFLVITDGATRE